VLGKNLPFQGGHFLIKKKHFAKKGEELPFGFTSSKKITSMMQHDSE